MAKLHRAVGRASSAVANTAAQAPPVRRQTVTDLALEAVREKILRGDYPEGAPLRQDALAADLGVSRIPVREALRQLEAEGLVTFSAHHGAVVSSLSLAAIEELFELRSVVEVELLRRAIPALTAADLERAEEILNAYDAAFEAGDVSTWGSLNWDFHSTLLLPADRPLTMGVVQNLQNQSDRYMRMQLALTHGEGRAQQEHRAIADAASRGDDQHACALMTAHILGAGRSLVQFLRVHRASSTSSSRAENP